MKIFLAGATGAIGQHLVPLLVGRGHQVVGTTRTPARVSALRQAGAEAVVVDALDREAVRRVVIAARPDVVVHQLTALAGAFDLRHFDESLAATNRLRTEGLDYLLDAAREAGARRFVAQSFTGWPNTRTGGRVKTEDDPLDDDPPASMRRTLDAIRRLERTVSASTDLVGVVLRYGAFYGPGTSIGPGGDLVEALRRRRLPIVGSGDGVWSFLHIADAASATRVAIERGPAGVYNIVDGEPAEVSAWLPELARAVGAAPPRHLPRWIGRMLIGEAGVSLMTEVRGSSNAKAREALGWRPAFATWRNGFWLGLETATAASRMPEMQPA